jgi:hypothetical protein
LSHEIGMSQERSPWKWPNATRAMPICEALFVLPGSESTSRAKGMHRKLGDPASDQWPAGRWPASGRRGAEADDARAREVGLRHSSSEADEQGGPGRRGVGGAKGGDQGECGSAKHAPGAVPGKCVTGAGPHTAAQICRQTPEVGAVCIEGARTDLCGGREATRVPTATRREIALTLGRPSDSNDSGNWQIDSPNWCTDRHHAQYHFGF